jgi:hypothetical protein
MNQPLHDVSQPDLTYVREENTTEFWKKTDYERRS